MAKYHINPKTGRPNLCNPEKTGVCAYAKDGENPPHYENKIEARAAYETSAAEEFGATKTLTREKPSETPEQEETENEGELSKYSFVRQFKEQEERFEEEFDGVPTRFFNADLRKKNFLVDPKVELEEADMLRDVWADPRKLVDGMFQALSAPTDANISDEEMIATGERLGLKLEKITNERYLRALGVKEAWIHVEEHESGTGSPSAYVISSEKKIGQGMTTYSMRFNPEDNLPRRFRALETRSLVGADRMQRKTGENLLQTYMHNRSANWRTGLNSEQREATIDALTKLEEAQLEGRSFKAQQKYVKESTGGIARVWDEKKDTDDVRKGMAANSKIKGKGMFRSIDLDNSVDPEAFSDFESAYEEIKAKLPQIPEGREPKLSVRRLGKHRATGIFAPALNHLAVDVRDSSAFIHEYGHFLDLVVKDNASLSKDFSSIAKDYSAGLRVPPGEPDSRREYLTSNHEIYARMFEQYAQKRLGIDNRLLNSDKFNEYDHAPITDNPELAERAFSFFDKLFEKDTKKN